MGVIVAGIAAISLQTGTMQALSQNAKDTLHHWRYEKTEELLPEGDLSKPVVKTESTDTILSVTADTAQTLYLRGFVGDTYENEAWTALDAETAAEEKDLFYWLHQDGFYAQSQLTTAAQAGVSDVLRYDNTVTVQNVGASGKYLYAPYELLADSDVLDAAQIGDRFLALGPEKPLFFGLLPKSPPPVRAGNPCPCS